jgi:hypothetical protein
VVEGQARVGTVVYLLGLEEDRSYRITSPRFETNRGEFERPKWLPGPGTYLSMIQSPGDLNPSGMKVYQLIWNQETPILAQVLALDDASAIFTWGPNGKWLIASSYRTEFAEDGSVRPVTDLQIVPIDVGAAAVPSVAEPAYQASQHVLSEAGYWLTQDEAYEGYLDWAP